MIRVSTSLRRLIEHWEEQGDVVARSLSDPEMTTDGKANYLTLREEDGLLSYLPRSKDDGNSALNPWLRRERQAARPGRVVRMVLTEPALRMLCEAEIEVFANRCSAASCLGEFTIVRGEGLRDWYNTDNTAVSSCMQGMGDYLDLYALNPDQVAMLILTKNDRLLGRALLWDTREAGQMMDRVYGDPATQCAFREWAVSHNMRNAYAADDTLTVALMHTDHMTYPYLDTFRQLYEGLGLSSSSYYLWDNRYPNAVLGYTDGGPRRREHCDNCGHAYNPEEEGREGYCYECYTASCCGHCGEFRNLNDTDFCNECWGAYVCMDCEWHSTRGNGLDGGYCDNCRDRHICRECDLRCEDANTEVIDGSCQDCRQQHTCTVCEAIHDTEELTTTPSGLICDACRQYRCDTCYRDFPNRMMLTLGERADRTPYPAYEDTYQRCVTCERTRLRAMLTAIKQKRVERATRDGFTQEPLVLQLTSPLDGASWQIVDHYLATGHVR